MRELISEWPRSASNPKGSPQGPFAANAGLPSSRASIIELSPVEESSPPQAMTKNVAALTQSARLNEDLLEHLLKKRETSRSQPATDHKILWAVAERG
jgi:hypothetical protein